MAAQMTRITDFFEVSQAPRQLRKERVVENQGAILEEDPTINQVHRNAPHGDVENQGVAVEPPWIKQQVSREREPRVVMVNRNQDADKVIHRVRHDDMARDNNLVVMVKRIIERNEVNISLHRPNYISPLSEYILQIEFPRGWKVPKFTKFSRDTSESIVEHVARYLTEAGDIVNNENMRIKYFLSSLTKNAFTWFTMLPTNLIHDWTRLERLFHKQFYMGHSKISLKELASIKRKFTEPIDDYLNRLYLLKARCFTQVLEHKLVKMGAGGLDYSIRKKLDTEYLRDMAQLDDRV